MRTPKMARIPLPASLDAPARRAAYRFLGTAAALAVLVLFWDSLLPLLVEGLHVLLEFVEVMLERLLEKLFHWTPRQAQTFLAWTGLALLVYWTVKLVRKACAEARRAFAALQSHGRACADSARAAWGGLAWFHFAGLAAAAVLAFYLFF